MRWTLYDSGLRRESCLREDLRSEWGIETYRTFRRVVFAFDFNEGFVADFFTRLDDFAVMFDLDSFFDDCLGRDVRAGAEATLAVPPRTDAILPAVFPIVWAVAIKTFSTMLPFVTFFFGI